MTLVPGILLLWKFAIIGKILGALLVVVGAVTTSSFVRTLVYEPGTIRIEPDRLTLPAGLCRGRNVELAWADVRHAFFLRRAVSWTQASPVLVVEAGDSAWTYPRDWFASEADQRQVLDAIRYRMESA